MNTCKYCHQPFVPRSHPDQAFCCKAHLREFVRSPFYTPPRLRHPVLPEENKSNNPAGINQFTKQEAR